MMRKRFLSEVRKAEQVAIRTRGAPQLEFILLALAQAERYCQRCLTLDPAHDFRDPLGGEKVIFTGLHHDGAVAEPFGLAGRSSRISSRVMR